MLYLMPFKMGERQELQWYLVKYERKREKFKLYKGQNHEPHNIVYDNADKLVSIGTVIRIESISSFHPLQSEEEVRGEFIEAWVIMTMSGTFTPNKQM